MLDCVKETKDKIVARNNAGIKVDSKLKADYINALLSTNQELAAKLISQYEPLLGVEYNPETNEILVTPTGNEKLLKAIDSEIESDNEIEDNGLSKAWGGINDHKISNVKLVAAIISSIPYINEIPTFNEINNTKYSYDGFLSYRSTYSVLKELYRDKRIIKDHKDLKLFLENLLQFDNSSLNETQKRIILSLYLHLFNQNTNSLVYTDLYKNLINKTSLLNQFNNSQDKEIRTKIDSLLSNIQINLTSVNDTSSLLSYTDNELIYDFGDATLQQRINLQRQASLNLYDFIASNESNDAKIAVNENTLNKFKDLAIKIVYNKGYKLVFKYNNKNISIPFDLTNSSVETGINVTGFIEKITNEISKDKLNSSSTKEDLIKLFSDTNLVTKLFDLVGFSNFTKPFINELINDKLISNPETRLENIYGILSSSIVGLALNINSSNFNGKTINYYPFDDISNDIYTFLNKTKGDNITSEDVEKIEKANKENGNYDLSATIISKTIAKSVEKSININKILQSNLLSQAGLDKLDIKTIFNNPLMFWLNTKYLAKKYADFYQLFRNESQYNINGDRVEKGNIVANIENVNRKILDIKTDRTIRYLNNIFVKGDIKITNIFRFDGYKGEDTTKNQMSFNETDINYSIIRIFSDGIIKGFDKLTKSSTLSYLFPEVYSDKSFFAALGLQSNYNQFPIDANNRLDFQQLFKKYYQVEVQNQNDFKNTFISSWNEWLNKEQEYLKLKGIEFKTFNNTQINELIDYINTIPLPNKPISLLDQKYYIKGENGNFTIKPLLKNYLLKQYNKNTENLDLYDPLVKKDFANFIAYYAYNHNDSIKAGLSFTDQSNDFLNSNKIYYNKDNYSNTSFDLSKFFKGKQIENGEFFIDKDSNDELVILPGIENNIETLYNEIIEKSNPFELSHFANYNILSDQLSQLILGDIWQYKGNTNKLMLQDKLKRSVGAASPGIKMSLDITLKEDYNLRVPETSLILKIEDEEIKKEILGLGKLEKKETYDGGSLVNPIYELMYKASFAGSIGLYPNSVLKFIYSNSNNFTSDNQLIKYAGHVISEEHYDKGMSDVIKYMEIMLGILPFERQVIIPSIKLLDIKGNTIILPSKTFNNNNSIYDIFLDLRKEKRNNPNLEFNTFAILADIISTNKNEKGILDLKNKMISQIIFTSSNKTGKSNIHNIDDIRNSVNGVYTSLDGQEVNIKNYLFSIDNNYLTMQLDGTHSPDNPKVTKFSQAITNAVLEGRTPELAKQLLETEGEITKIENERMQRIFSEGIIDFIGNKEENIDPDFDILELRLEKLIENDSEIGQYNFKESYERWDKDYEKEELKDELISKFNELNKEAKVKLILRYLVLDGMDNQGQYNSTYEILDSNNFSYQDAQIIDKLNSAIASYISKRTINTTFPGGNYILTTSTNLVGVVDIERNGQKYTVTLDKVKEGEEGKYPRNLKWKGYINKNTGENLFNKDKEGNYTNSIWKSYVDAFTDEQKSIAKNNLQKLLDSNEWIIEPAEFIMPYPYKKNFRIKDRMQPINVTKEYLMEVFGIDEVEVEEKYNTFQKSLEIIVNRIPSTGMQSTTIGKIVGFFESNKNSIFIPIELMMIQGADLDIDKAVVIGRNFDDNGKYIDKGVKGLQNQMIQSLYDIYGNNKNQIQADTPVGFKTLKEIQNLFEKLSKESLKFNNKLPMSVVRAKILTAEGKAMVGVFANGLKAFGIVYYVAKQALLNKTTSPIKPLNLDIIITNENNEISGFINTKEKYNNVANLDIENPTKQMWEFYSELVNAATDNAKEMILGAIGANLQTGNMINAMTLYGVQALDMFKILTQPNIQKVLDYLRHANDINNNIIKIYDINEIIYSVFSEYSNNLSGKNFDKKLNIKASKEEFTKLYNSHRAIINDPIKRLELDNQFRLLNSFKKMYELGEEFGITASALSINRELPNTPYLKYKYNDDIENYINKEISNLPKDKREELKLDKFSISNFVNSEFDSKQTWIKVYNEYIQKSINLLQILEEAPHIKQYLKTKIDTDKLLNNIFPINKESILILDSMKSLINKIKTPSEDIYNNIKRLLNEKIIAEFVKNEKITLNINGNINKFDLSSNAEISAFLKVFPNYLFKVINNGLNPQLTNNEFYKALQIITDRKGQYIGIPNIDALDDTRIFELLFETNKELNDFINLGGTWIKNIEFKKQLFLYSILTSKGKVSTSSFFELFNASNRKDYVDYLKNNPNILAKVSISSKEDLINNIDWIKTNPEILPYGKQYIVSEKSYSEDGFSSGRIESKIYSVKPDFKQEDLPKFIYLFFKGTRSVYEKTIQSFTNNSNKLVYALVNNIYPVIAINSYNGSERIHYNETQTFKKINDINTVNQIYKGDKVKINIDNPKNKTVVTDIGELYYDNIDKSIIKRSKELNQNNINLNKKVDLQLLTNIINKVGKKFNIPVNTYNDSQSLTKGYVKDGEIYINTTLASIDTPLHEFGHIYLEIINKSNPELYNKIVKEALADNSYISNTIRNKYPELNEKDLGEEIFVTHLGLSTTDSDYINELKISPSNKIASLIKDFIEAIRSALSFIGLGNKSIDTNSTLFDLINNIKKDILSDSELSFNIGIQDISLLDSFKQSKDLSIKNIGDFINSLIPYDKNIKELESLQYYKGFVDVIKAIMDNPNDKTQAAIKYEMIKKGISDKVFNQAIEVYGKLSTSELLGSRYQQIALLTELDKYSYTDKNGELQYPYKSIDLTQFKDYPNILVVIDSSDNRREISLFDISFNALNANNLLPNKNTNLFGIHISDEEANKLGIDFTVKQSHVNALKLGLLSIQLKEKLDIKSREGKKVFNTGIKVLQSFSQSDGILKDGYFIDDVVRNIKKALKNPKFNNYYSEFLKPYINEKTDPQIHRINVIQLYKQFLVNRITISSKSLYNTADLQYYEKLKVRVNKLIKLIEDYEEEVNSETINAIIDEVRDRQLNLLKNSSDSDEIKEFNKREIEFTEKLLLELIETKGAYEVHNKSLLEGVNARLARIGATGNSVLDKFYQLMVAAMSKAQNYLNSFSKEFDPILNKLMKDYKDRNGFISGSLEDFTINDARKFFKNMLESIDVENEKGDKVKVFTGRLIDKNSSEYNNLSNIEKQFINFFNEQISKSASQVGKVLHEKYVTENLIPLMKLNSAYTNIDTLKGLGKLSWEQSKEDFINASKSLTNTGFENGEFFVEDPPKAGVSLDVFRGQFPFYSEKGEVHKYGGENRLATLGLIEDKKGKLTLIDESKNKNLETDLSIVLHNFVFSKAKHAEFKKIEPLTSAIRSCLRFRNVVLGKTDIALEFADEYYQKYVNNLNADSEGMKPFAKIMYKLQSQSSLVAIGYNIGSAVSNFGAATASTIKEAMYNTLLSVTNDKPPFNLIDLGKAFTIVALEKFKNFTNQDKIDAINALYKVFNQDVSYLQNNIATQKGIMKTKNAYWFNTVGDKLNREVLIVAQMIGDGSWEAYDYKDEKLIYDETKDKRFFTNGKYNENHPLLKVFKEEMIKDGEGIKDGKLTQGYTRLNRNAIKALSDKVYGSYDDENASKLSNYAFGRLFTSFKKYMIDKQRQYFGNKIYTENDGEYTPIYKDNDPTKEIVGYAPIGREQEGIWFTLARTIKELTKNRNLGKTWSELDQFEKRNLIYLLNDAFFLTILMVGFNALFGDKDDEWKDDHKYEIKFYKGFLDTASLNMLFGFNNFTESPTFIPQSSMVIKPFMVTSFLDKQLKMFTKVVSGKIENEEDEEKRAKAFYDFIGNFPNQVSTTVRIGRQASSYYDELINSEEENE